MYKHKPSATIPGGKASPESREAETLAKNMLKSTTPKISPQGDTRVVRVTKITGNC